MKFNKIFRLLFDLYIYPTDLQEGARGQSIILSPDLLPEMPRYCCPVEIFYFYKDMSEIKNYLTTLPSRQRCHEVSFSRTQQNGVNRF